VKCSNPSRGNKFPTCREEAEGSTPEYIVVGFERWVWIEGFVRAAMNPLFSSSDMTGDMVWFHLLIPSRSRGMRGLMM
jgi:hypothetical protein